MRKTKKRAGDFTGNLLDSPKKKHETFANKVAKSKPYEGSDNRMITEGKLKHILDNYDKDDDTEPIRMTKEAKIEKKLRQKMNEKKHSQKHHHHHHHRR